MSLRHLFTRYALGGLLVLAISGTASATDQKTTNAILGAGLGAAAGAVLSEGDPMLTLGGAAAGGLLGHVLTENRYDHNRGYRRHYRTHRHYGPPPHRYVNKHYARGHHKKYRSHHKYKRKYKH